MGNKVQNMFKESIRCWLGRVTDGLSMQQALFWEVIPCRPVSENQVSQGQKEHDKKKDCNMQLAYKEAVTAAPDRKQRRRSVPQGQGQGVI